MTENYFEDNNILNIYKMIDIRKKVSPKTFMEVSGYPHFENVASNILAFFFTTDEEHGFGNLFFKSLLEIILGNADGDTQNVTSIREYTTRKGNRIDIVLMNDNYIVGIENKIFSGVNNDLLDYKQTVDKNAAYEMKTPLHIVLSLRDESNIAKQNDFYNLTYGSFFKVIRKNLERYIQPVDNPWLIYLKDFMKTIDELQNGGIPMNIDLLNFMKVNNLEVQKLIDDYNMLKKDMIQKTKKIKELIELDKYKLNMQFSDYIHNPQDELTSSYVIDFQKTPDKILVIETYIDAQGWHIAIWDRCGGNNGKEELEKIFTDLKMETSKRIIDKKQNSKFIVVEDLNYDTPPLVLIDKIYEKIDFVQTLQI